MVTQFHGDARTCPLNRHPVQRDIVDVANNIRTLMDMPVIVD